MDETPVERVSRLEAKIMANKLWSKKQALINLRYYIKGYNKLPEDQKTALLWLQLRGGEGQLIDDEFHAKNGDISTEDNTIWFRLMTEKYIEASFGDGRVAVAGMIGGWGA